MGLHESTRLAYLQALGITQYVPLQSVAGALQLPPLDGQDSADAIPAAGEPAGTGPVPTGLPQNGVAAQQSAAQSSAAPAAETSPVPQPAPAAGHDIPQLDVSKLKPARAAQPAAKSQAPAAPRFTLAVLTLAGRARLLVELGRFDAPGFSALEHRLLGDLLLALGIRQDISDSHLFRWPPVNNPRVADELDAARVGLLAFIDGAQNRQPLPRLLFLGTAALSCFPAQKTGAAFHLTDTQGPECLFTHSLAALQKDWTLKAGFWQQVREFL